MTHLLDALTSGELAHSGILDHIAELIREQAENKSELKGLSKIEIFSYYLRKNKFKFTQHLEDHHLSKIINQQKQYPFYVSSLQALLNKLGRIDNKKAILRSDLMQEYAALRVAGISIGQTNAFHLNKVIKTLAIENQTKDIRFWGKILGYNDYFVIQGTSTKNYINQLGQNSQKYGTGVNMYSYWVSTSILGQWNELPLVTPAQVKGSKDFKYIFSGNLEKDISMSTSFVGKEKHLLKCIVARISHSCELVPKGIYKLNEQNPSIVEFQEEFKIPQVAEMNSIDSWIHFNPHILQQGRCSYYVDPKLSEEQREALNAELAEKDPMIQRFKGIGEDKPYEALGYTSNWAVGICGETVPVNLVGKQQGQTAIYGVALLRNLAWPGACTVGFRGGWTNIYIGYGHRISQSYNAIKELKDLQTEGQDRAERPQPNPSKPKEQKKEEPVAVEGGEGQAPPSQ